MAGRVRAKEQESIYFYAMNKNMANQFNHFKQLYQDNKFDVLLKEDGAIYWLKLRSISRKALMVEFCELANIDCADIKGPKLFEHIYNQKPSEKLLDKFIDEKYEEERAERKEGETKLISELYKLQVFDWGGLYQNNLERTIVDNYIKKIKDFDLLTKKVEGEIHESMRSYVLSSWFNHWTSILIEDIFKDHEKVTPTVGLIKKVDFFVGDVPFDLKVTYFPDGFMQMKRRELGLSTEIQELKRFARQKGIKYDRKQKDKVIFIELLTRFKESVDPETKKFWKQFNDTRKKIVKDTIAKPDTLIRWLYEEQGERRFDAANRLFLVLMDEDSLEESWKMKRNLDLLSDKINSYLNKLDLKDTKQFEITFDWKDGRKYSALADVVFITKE
jgi:hypothetical protein